MINQLRESVQTIRQRAPGFVPDIALVLGSGLGYLGDFCQNAVTVPYAEIPGFPVSTAPGHAGRLVLGELSGKRVAVMQGRFHYYEGHSYEMAV
jgi:purine-nucleoside phosphorylase